MRLIKEKYLFSALTVSNKDKRKIIKTGSIVKSWMLNITKHVFVGLKLKNVIKKPVEVDFVTARCLLHPAEIFKIAGNYNSKLFPHYGGDDEFSMRIKKYGYSTLVVPNIIVYLKDNKKKF